MRQQDIPEILRIYFALGSEKHYLREGCKTRLTEFFLGDDFTKIYQNRLTYIRVTVSDTVIFLRNIMS